MPTIAEMARLSANAMARGLADDACREKHGSLTRAAVYAQWFIEALKDAGLPEHVKVGSDLHGTLGTVIDSLSEAAGLIEREACSQGIAPECFPLDLNELSAMWAKMDENKPLFGDIRRLVQP